MAVSARPISSAMMSMFACSSCRQSASRLSFRVLSSYPEVLRGDTVRIGCSSGFWGDTSVADKQLVQHGKLDFLVSDYLAEITMSLLVASRRKNPDGGYAPDFISNCIVPNLKSIKDQGVRVVTNAGGINPHGCVDMVKKVAKSQGVDVSVAMVTGDDMLPMIDQVRGSGLALDIDTGQALPKSVLSMNAYLGAFPIAKALDAGADIVITGRCVDSALALGPLIHKFGWKPNDYDMLSSGSLAGHLIECGAQSTGGIFTDWDSVPDWDNIGFPIVECSSTGPFVVTKPPGTGGVVNYGTVAEQLVYEIGDPAHYTLPDVSCDFRNVKLTTLQEPDSVLVEGARGTPPPLEYKVSATHMSGYRSTVVCVVVGPRAKEKAIKTANSILKRVRRLFKDNGFQDFSKTLIHTVGSGQSYGPSHSTSWDSHEITLWLGVQHKQKEALELFSKEIAAAGTGMAPGFANLVGGRPKPTPVLKLFSFFYPKKDLPVTVTINGTPIDDTVYDNSSSRTSSDVSSDVTMETVGTNQSNSSVVSSQNSEAAFIHGNHYQLHQLAYLRSGDKGNSCNIGVVARDPQHYPFLKEILTEEFVTSKFQHFHEPNNNNPTVDFVKRYELPGICGLNFVLNQSLGGGGVSSLRVDPQGKAYAQMLAGITVQYKK